LCGRAISDFKSQISGFMTRAHRQRHRRVWIALAGLLLAVFLAGLLARRPVPVMSRATDPLAPRPSHLFPR
jgi:hypothetical protein